MNMNYVGHAFLIAALLVLGGCGQWERTKANYTGYSEVCVDGVTYLQFPSGASVKYGVDSKVVGCK